MRSVANAALSSRTERGISHRPLDHANLNSVTQASIVRSLACARDDSVKSRTSVSLRRSSISFAEARRDKHRPPAHRGSGSDSPVFRVGKKLHRRSCFAELLFRRNRAEYYSTKSGRIRRRGELPSPEK